MTAWWDKNWKVADSDTKTRSWYLPNTSIRCLSTYSHLYDLQYQMPQTGKLASWLQAELEGSINTAPPQNLS
jgi:hypothetical protein